MPLTIGPRLRAFFDEKLLAILATVNERGVPEMTPIWYMFADGYIWINGESTRVWGRRIEETGRATFLVSDPQVAWRWVQVYGRLVEAQDDPGAVQKSRLSHRYQGREWRGGLDNRRWFKIEITSVKGGDGSPERAWDVTEG